MSPDQDETAQAVDRSSGFLPITTNAFDRVFIATVIFVAIHLLWMRLVESYVPLYAATVLSLLVGALIVARG
jgi:predicted small integral membrane protein